ncbi:hypothetical protein LOK46_01320 [Methylobacterium sp. NMS14P]|uniref:hypothetical protein n=1 Tax=Methylobacterium sp. NMS14P TaxID=2894310 RepID=UPI002358E49D|nr:hypothetical protein [Methylobacterium sp. NMS14P]WCS25510.1 hypothetical protein LOK46_01320 [Methylobacterium sp. NMS14P]
MTSGTLVKPLDVGGPLSRRAAALANVRWFRALAWRALRDGGPRAELRASNARAAARIVLRQAKREALVARLARQALDAAV